MKREANLERRDDVEREEGGWGRLMEENRIYEPAKNQTINLWRDSAVLPLGLND